MNWYKAQPTPIKAAIPLGAVLVVLAIAMTLMGRGPDQKVIAHSSDRGLIEAWQWRLTEDKIKTDLVFNADTQEYELKVLAADEPKAALTLGGTNLTKRIKMDSTKACPALKAIPNRSATIERNKCQVEAKIHDALMSIEGIDAVKVNYDEAEEAGLTGTKDMTATVMLFLRKDERGKPMAKLDPANLASIVANSRAGMTEERVQILTSNNEKLWDGKKGGTQAGATIGGTGCQDSAEIDDISTKERLNSDCVEARILKTVAPIAGGEQFVQIVANYVLNDTTMTRKTVRNTRGPAVSTDNFDKESNSSSFLPNSQETQEQRNAGSMKTLRLSVVLDSKHVKTTQKIAIEEALKNWVDDPRNLKVVFADFAGGLEESATGATTGAAAAPTSPTDAAAAPTTGSTDEGTEATSTPTDIPVTGKPAIPTNIMILGFLLLLGLITTIVLLWRRSAMLARQRSAFEQEFRSELGAFSSFAEQDPDVMAAQLEALLGQPAGRPTQGEELTPR